MSNRDTIIAPSPLRCLRTGSYDSPPHLSIPIKNVSYQDNYPTNQGIPAQLVSEKQKDTDPIVNNTDYLFALFELRAIVGSAPYAMYEPIDRRNHLDISRELLLFPMTSCDMKCIEYDVRSTPLAET